jgi:hypothetical protein
VSDEDLGEMDLVGFGSAHLDDAAAAGWELGAGLDVSVRTTSP